MKTEQSLHIPPLTISASTADKMISELHNVAEQKTLAEVEQRLRNGYRADPAQARKIDQGAVNEDAFVARNMNNAGLRAAMNLQSSEKYTFLSPTSNVLFDSPDFSIEDLPSDIHTIYCRADGVDRFIEIKVTTHFKDFNDVRNRQANQILIQGSDKAWVHATYHNFNQLVETETRKTRAFVYGNALLLFWSSVVLLLFAEYTLTKLVRPGFNLREPLTGTGALVMFGVLLGSLLVFANSIISLYTYWFPYFEIEKNLSRTRIEARTLVKGIIAAGYTAALFNVVKLIFGPTFSKWFG